LWVLLGISLLFNLRFLADQAVDNPLPEKFHSLNRHARDKVAILAVKGTIAGEERYFQRQIEQIRHDDRVKAIVLRVESPGGTITGSDFIYHHIQKLIQEKDIPMVVSMGSIAASGGYYVSMSVGDKKKVLYAEPTTWTGSIGVIIPHYDFSELLERYDVKDDSTSSHPLKQMGSLTRKFPPEVKEEEQRILKELVDESFASFKELVLKNRSPLRQNAEAQEKVFTGRIFTAVQAKDLGLVDELGYIEDAISRACELANLDPNDTRVIEYEQHEGLLDQFIFGRSAPRKALSPWELLDSSSPQALYLCSWMPGWAMRHEGDRD
jgi:protease-4